MTTADEFAGLSSATPRTCLVCAANDSLTRFTDRTVERRSGKHAVAVDGLAGSECGNCGHVFYDGESADRLSYAGDQVVLAAREDRKAKGAALRLVRESLGMTQAEASALTGGGHNAFQRYESGAADPVAAVTNLFACFARHPELVDELRNTTRVSASDQTKEISETERGRAPDMDELAKSLRVALNQRIKKARRPLVVGASSRNLFSAAEHMAKHQERITIEMVRAPSGKQLRQYRGGKIIKSALSAPDDSSPLEQAAAILIAASSQTKRTHEKAARTKKQKSSTDR